MQAPGRRAADRALAAAPLIIAVMYALGFLVQPRWVMSVLWCVPGTMQARAINDGFLRARGEPDYRVHAATRYLRAFDHGMRACVLFMSAWYTHALFGVQGHSGAVGAAWIVMTWWWFFEATFLDTPAARWNPGLLDAEAGLYRLTATRGLAWSQLVVAAYYLCGGCSMGYSDRVWHVPVLGSCAGGAGGYFWLAVLGWCLQVERWFGGRLSGPPHMASTQRFLIVFDGIGTFVDRSWAAVAACDIQVTLQVTGFLLLAACYPRSFISTDNILLTSVSAVVIARPYLQGALSANAVVTVDLAIAAAMLFLSAGFAQDFVVGKHSWIAAGLSLSACLRGMDAVLDIVETIGWGRTVEGQGDVATAPGSRAASAATRPRRTYSCGWCGAAGAGKRCAGCGEVDPVHYCGRNCQEHHWSSETDPHKAHCRGRRRRHEHGGANPTPPAA